MLANATSYGMELHNLVYKSAHGRVSQRKIVIYLLYEVFGLWLWQRVSVFMVSENWASKSLPDYRARVWLLVQNLEIMYNSLDLINLLVFLKNGK